MSSSNQKMLEEALALYDAANSKDPNIEKEDGKDIPKELLYSKRMLDMLSRFIPDAEDVAKLSVAAQHIERWKSPRSDYPMNRKGYHLWRTNLYKFHAETAAKYLTEAGYDEETIERVKLAINKKNLKTNPDTQVVEDIAALTFIEHYMTAMYEKFTEYDEDKWIDIIIRTWKKMSPAAHDFALSGSVKLPEGLVPVIQKALAKAAAT
ncbi:DUF4202 domain-containing protein [uncultured Cocleimonas sp.]|uniref:DUF4202 domain-containing protein n=1 Tax=uncultured Cocleimonas sp. TaxID=1051587 RepID=UPI002615122E|nr:DUF4202 domain-containing protein [uncultured Cocleimonas sp.]